MTTTERPDYLRWAIAVVVLGGCAAALWFGLRPSPEPAPAAPVPAAVPAPTSGTTAPRHPIEPATPTESTTPAVVEEPLPSLYDADPAFAEALRALAADEAVFAALRLDSLIPRIVATVDNLPRRKLAPELRPVQPAPGALVVDAVDGGGAIAASNAERYAVPMRLIAATDATAAAALYRRWYPLFQQAYRDLGESDRYFNDRLVEVIDHLLAAPEPAGPLRVYRDGPVWRYEAAAYEAGSAGHKILWRVGPAHAATIKAKLREFRAAVAADGGG